MRIALISDVHANLPALKAVLKDIADSEIDDIISLGDVVGYGAQPAECVDLLRNLRGLSVMGNHDFFVASQSPAMEDVLANPDAIDNPVWSGIRHAREQLDQEQLDWLRALELAGEVEGGLVAHAALHDFEAWPYLRALEDARPTLKILNGRVGFFGHTHRENVFSDPDALAPELIEERTFRLPVDTSIAITAGGTGQPRDGDPRARWLAWEPETRTLKFHRVPYDHQAAADAIVAAGLPERSARRLLG